MNIADLESLLHKDRKLEFNQDKWFKSLFNGTITINEQLYTLKVTSNKRQLVYKNNTLINTIPYISNSDKTITLTPLG